MYFGRAFTVRTPVGELQIDPCGLCGTPQFPGRVHECVGRDQKRLTLILTERDLEESE
jgi:hypothetical protein